MDVRRVKEDLYGKLTKELRLCWVRSGTDNPCHRPASVKVGGMPFCESCAREQEAYFAISELTEKPRSRYSDERLAGLLGRMPRIGTRRSVTDNHGYDAA